MDEACMHAQHVFVRKETTIPAAGPVFTRTINVRTLSIIFESVEASHLNTLKHM